MRRFKVKYDWLLFAILMVLLFVPIIQEWTNLFAMKPLSGVLQPTPKPVFTFESYRENSFSQQAEKHLSENFGMREPVIRLYNQYLYDFYKKTTNGDVAIGKDHWIYFRNNVNDYYGTEMSHCYRSNEEAKEAFDTEARLMWKLRGVLKEYGVDFLVFMAPDKSFVYPEHLPMGDFDTTSVNARDYYASLFDAYGFPYIEMTKWFIDIKAADTLPYPVFPPTGMHWNFSSVYAMDSLLRFMGDLKNQKLPALRIGPLHVSSKTTAHGDRDIERLANLARPIPTPGYQSYDADVSVVTDENTFLPNVIFVGSSFLERMYYFVPFDSLFSYSEYWYYNSTIRYGKDYQKSMSVYEKDVLQALLDADYVVWQAVGEQMYNASFGFVESALMYLCFSDETVFRRHKHLMDSLNITSRQAYDTLLKHFEACFPEIVDEDIPTIRNPRIPEALVINEIKKDPDWMTTLRCQSVLQQISLKETMKAEAQNVLNERPLLRDAAQTFTREVYIESLVEEMAEDIRHKPDMVTFIQEKCKHTGKTFEEQLDADARWIINERIQNGTIVLDGFE